jgi:hypothetical protein
MHGFDSITASVVLLWIKQLTGFLANQMRVHNYYKFIVQSTYKLYTVHFNSEAGSAPRQAK